MGRDVSQDQLATVAVGARLRVHQKPESGAVHKREPGEIEHDARGSRALGIVKFVVESGNGLEVDLAADAELLAVEACPPEIP